MSLSCREVSHLSNDYLSKELDWNTTIRIRFHLLLCHKCRRFIRHVDVAHQYVVRQLKPDVLTQSDLNEVMKKINLESNDEH